MRLRNLILVIFTSLHATCWAQSKCYFPDGSESFEDKPCDSNARFSPCCRAEAGSYCMDTKLCRMPNGDLSRGSCSDQDWQSLACAHHCPGNAVGGMIVKTCSNSTDTFYCCDYMKGCCQTGRGGVEIKPANPRTWASYDTASRQFVTFFPANFQAEPTPSAQASTTTSATSTSPSVVDVSASSSSGPGPTSDSTSTQQEQQTPEPRRSGLSSAAYAGVGAGSVVAGVAVIGLGFLFWKKRNRDDNVENRQPDIPPHSEYPHAWNHRHPRLKELGSSLEAREMDASRTGGRSELP